MLSQTSRFRDSIFRNQGLPFYTFILSGVIHDQVKTVLVVMFTVQSAILHFSYVYVFLLTYYFAEI